MLSGTHMFNAELESTEVPAPISEATVNVIEKPKPIFFFQRVDEDGAPIGEPFATHELEGEQLLKRLHKRPIYLGWSDGTEYARILKEEGLIKGKKFPVEKAQQILNKAFKAEFERAKGNKTRRPRPSHAHFDASFFRHNGDPRDVQGFIGGGQ